MYIQTIKDCSVSILINIKEKDFDGQKKIGQWGRKQIKEKPKQKIYKKTHYEEQHTVTNLNSQEFQCILHFRPLDPKYYLLFFPMPFVFSLGFLKVSLALEVQFHNLLNFLNLKEKQSEATLQVRIHEKFVLHNKSSCCFHSVFQPNKWLSSWSRVLLSETFLCLCLG